jgi:hypothetical protein
MTETEIGRRKIGVGDELIWTTLSEMRRQDQRRHVQSLWQAATGSPQGFPARTKKFADRTRLGGKPPVTKGEDDDEDNETRIP